MSISEEKMACRVGVASCKACVVFVFELVLFIMALVACGDAKDRFHELVKTAGHEEVQALKCDKFYSPVHVFMLDTNSSADLADVLVDCGDVEPWHEYSAGMWLSLSGDYTMEKDDLRDFRDLMFILYAVQYAILFITVVLTGCHRDSGLQASMNDDDGSLKQHEEEKGRLRKLCDLFTAELSTELIFFMAKVCLINNYLCSVEDGYFVTPFISDGLVILSMASIFALICSVQCLPAFVLCCGQGCGVMIMGVLMIWCLFSVVVITIPSLVISVNGIDFLMKVHGNSTNDTLSMLGMLGFYAGIARILIVILLRLGFGLDSDDE